MVVFICIPAILRAPEISLREEQKKKRVEVLCFPLKMPIRGWDGQP